MPVYEYRCGNCQNRVGIFQTYAEYGKKKVTCPICGSKKLARAIGRVRVARSEESRMDSLADPSAFGDIDENDPKSLARMMRKMKSEMGDEAGGDIGPEFDEAIDRLEAGESPEDVERALPGLAEGGGAEDMGMGMGDDF